VDPAGGSTVSAATASVATMSSVRTLGLAPFRTARSPAVTPAPPRMAASQSPPVTTSVETRTDCRSQGGPQAGTAIGGYIRLLRTIDAATMIRIELPIPADASRVRTRARRGANDVVRNKGWGVLA
jgi:hypothetical protein